MSATHTSPSYLGALFPCLYLVTIVHTGRLVGVATIGWGITLLCMAACKNFAGLATVRFILGIFECEDQSGSSLRARSLIALHCIAAILPCFMVLQVKWWRRSEQALRTALWVCPSLAWGQIKLMA